jgi:SAM-dependent methyltransferase
MADEGERLRLLEELADGRTRALLERTGIDRGWRCAEVGAGAGSVARWLGDRVGPTGSVLAIDVDTTLLQPLGAGDTITVVEADITASPLPAGAFDLVHVRNLLMHLPERDAVLRHLAACLAPGGVLVVEEADGFPLSAASSSTFRRALAPLLSRWTWARALPDHVTEAGLEVEDVVVDAEMVHGGTALAAFWHHTLRSARDLCVGHDGLTDDELDGTLGSLRDPRFWSPFLAVVCVVGRRPPTRGAAQE